MPSPLGRVAPKEPGEVQYKVASIANFGEFLLLQDLIRPRCARPPSPKGKALESLITQKTALSGLGQGGGFVWG